MGAAMSLTSNICGFRTYNCHKLSCGYHAAAMDRVQTIGLIGGVVIPLLVVLAAIFLI